MTIKKKGYNLLIYKMYLAYLSKPVHAFTTPPTTPSIMLTELILIISPLANPRERKKTDLY